MALLADLKARLTTAMKAGDANAKNVIRVVLSKVQTGGKETDEAVISAVKTCINQNDEEIEARSGRPKNSDGTVREVAVSGQEGDIARLKAEIAILKEFLPTYLSADEIKAILEQADNKAQLAGAKNAGAATGIALKILKAHGPVEGGTVKDVVAQIL